MCTSGAVLNGSAHQGLPQTEELEWQHVREAIGSSVSDLQIRAQLDDIFHISEGTLSTPFARCNRRFSADGDGIVYLG